MVCFESEKWNCYGIWSHPFHLFDAFLTLQQPRGSWKSLIYRDTCLYLHVRLNPEFWNVYLSARRHFNTVKNAWTWHKHNTWTPFQTSPLSSTIHSNWRMIPLFSTTVLRLVIHKSLWEKFWDCMNSIVISYIRFWVKIVCYSWA